jgi:NADH-dependent peroxiredoxin subunit F
MLETALREQLQSALTHLKAPIELIAFLDQSPASDELRTLLHEIAGASLLVSLREAPQSSSSIRTPSFSIALTGQAPRVHFAGLPLGHEFTSLILALLHVSGHPPRVPAEQLLQAESLPGPLRIETYFSASCQNCPDVVQALNILAARNPNVEHTTIDGALFQSEVEQRQVLAVPSVFINGVLFAQGRMELLDILKKLDTTSAARDQASLQAKEPFDMLVVGGGPAGAAAAVYAARKGIRVGLIAERFGGQVADTLAIENYPSVLETEGPKMVTAMEAHIRSYPVDLIKGERVASIVEGDVLSVNLEGGATLRARSMVVAPGARWRDLNIPGEAEYRTRGVTYCPHCDGPLFKGKRVAVIGGGNSGVEAAIDLAGVVGHVTLLEYASALKADDVLVQKLKSLSNVQIVTEARTTEIVGDGSKVVGLRYEARATGVMNEIPVAGVFVQIGLLPSTGFLKGTLQLSAFGEIVVDAKGQTSMPGVFAAGDATTVPFKQIVIAAGDGAKAALGAFEHLMRT